MSITIELEDKKIKLTSEVINLINSYRQLSLYACEAGGILIGRENKESGNLIIEYATEPFAKDKRTRTSFLRKDNKHVEFYNKLYKEHKGIYAYFGEWHTHPEEVPNYSCMDIRNWRKISQMNEDKEKIYYHVIAGTKDIRVWQYSYVTKQAYRIY